MEKIILLVIILLLIIIVELIIILNNLRLLAKTIRKEISDINREIKHLEHNLNGTILYRTEAGKKLHVDERCVANTTKIFVSDDMYLFARDAGLFCKMCDK